MSQRDFPLRSGNLTNGHHSQQKRRSQVPSAEEIAQLRLQLPELRFGPSTSSRHSAPFTPSLLPDNRRQAAWYACLRVVSNFCGLAGSSDEPIGLIQHLRRDREPQGFRNLQVVGERRQYFPSPSVLASPLSFIGAVSIVYPELLRVRHIRKRLPYESSRASGLSQTSTEKKPEPTGPSRTERSGQSSTEFCQRSAQPQFEPGRADRAADRR